ncbi:chromate efflux transporter [Microvirga flavescens]|uniref:chromate efflux transporter n=1 Tax=Microvirga flavescens TaxID=2249811 RepID=UPI000DD4F34C|nr:chromate efflux transporter [Microvirga flavescens]
MTPDIETPRHPTLAEATKVWAKIGLLSFGGPAGQIALMHKLLVEEKRWIGEARFLHALNYCMLLPGPEAQQLATYIGWLLHGTRGGVIAGMLFIVPGFFVILTLSTLYASFQNAAWLGHLFFGLKAAVLAIVIEAVIRIGRRALKGRLMVALAAAAFIAIYALHVPFPLIILVAGLIGYAGARLAPDLFVSQPEKASAGNGAIIDALLDSGRAGVEPTLGHALKTLAIWGGLWVAPIILLGVIFGWHSVYATIAAFFSKMAVVTFGGAYAVLAYVAQQAVETYGWLKPGEMLDGLALAETTPGPLILVLTYVGFLAAFRDPGGVSALTGGIIGAMLTTWVTFAPCFLWIFLGAPYVERLRSNVALSGALAAITAAVVGVILNLALWFGLHVLFRSVTELDLGPLSPAWPVWSSVDPFALALSLVAVVALFRLKLGMVATLALCAVLGFAVQFVR